MRRKDVAHKRSRRRRRKHAPGSAPGTLSAVPDSPAPMIAVIAFGPEQVVESAVPSVSAVDDYLGKFPVAWFNVNGLGETDTIAALGKRFGIHRLALEDVVNVHQRAKVEHYEKQLYIVIQQVLMQEGLDTEQISIFVGPGYVLTFQVKPGDVFDPVRERIRGGRGRMRQAGPGYLAYTLLDAVVDHYFPVLESMGERLERLEEEVLERPTPATLAEIMRSKRELLTLRRSIWPLRDAVHQLLREESEFIQQEDRYYFQDCYDHAVRVLEMVESHRELASSLMDVYLSSLSNKMNEIMKVLTLFASIFIPLGFVAGLYGMNFNGEISPWNMPELQWPLGYPFALLVMAGIAGGLLIYFWRRGWIGSGPRPRPPSDQAPGTDGSNAPGGHS